LIAIDGTAASGKSTIGRLLAERLGYTFFDTGVMYRAVTWEALCRQIPIEDEDAITRLAETMHIDVTRPTVEDGRPYTVWSEGRDVTWEIRQPGVDKNVSMVSEYPGVRAALTTQQRRIGERGRVVMIGRDIGTVVLPHADLKIFLDASLEERARRRYREILARGGQADLESVREELRRRDYIDSHRATAPLSLAEDAVFIDTDNLSIDQVLSRVLELIRERTPCRRQKIENAKEG